MKKQIEIKNPKDALLLILIIVGSALLAYGAIEGISILKHGANIRLRERSIAIENEAQIEGIGAFSVSADKQVTFAPGNLQYHLRDKKWQFAANQSDIIGYLDDTDDIPLDYFGWIDLFNWKTATLPSATWRLLSMDEWVYVISRRENAEALFALGIVNNEAGMILLPDNWVQPDSVCFTPSMTKGLFREEGMNDIFRNTTSKSYFDNIYNADQWSLMQQAGAVFLPAGGYRWRDHIFYVGYHGQYWSSTLYEKYAVHLMFEWDYVLQRACSRASFGYSVRMVKDL